MSEDVRMLSDDELDRRIEELKKIEDLAEGTEYGIEVTYNIQKVREEVNFRKKCTSDTAKDDLAMGRTPKPPKDYADPEVPNYADDRDNLRTILKSND